MTKNFKKIMDIIKRKELELRQDCVTSIRYEQLLCGWSLKETEIITYKVYCRNMCNDMIETVYTIRTNKDSKNTFNMRVESYIDDAVESCLHYYSNDKITIKEIEEIFD